MGIELKGHILNQRQLDAITPVMNSLLQGEVTQAGFEQACIDALLKAGCPLGYDTSLNRSETVGQRAAKWIVDGRVGMSSKAIWAHMTDTPLKDDRYSYPLDPDDLNRCLLLLDLIPEWKPRMHEMEEHGPNWAGLAAQWKTISDCFLEEVGLDWCKGKSAPNTYALMKKAIGEEPGAIRFGAMSFRTE
ncbi:hypothetical protein D9M71_148520 [compost metagenome]